MKVAKNRKKLTSDGQGDGAHRRLISQIELLQMRMLAAEETWKQAKEQFSQARRRRKLAKLFAKRAKKDTKRAEENLDLARKALANAKAQAMASGRAAAEKVGKTKDSRIVSKKQPTAKRRVRKLPLTRTKAISLKPLAALAPPADSIPADADAAASLPTTPPDETRAMA